MKKSRSKYNVSKDKSKRISDGIVFDSELEKRYYDEVVKKGLRDGSIISWDRQIRFTLQPSFKKNGKNIRAIEYKADFSITDTAGNVKYVDIKGAATSDAKLKRKLFWYVYPELDYSWLGYSTLDSIDGSGWADYDAIQLGRKARRNLRRNKDDEKKK